MLSVIIMAALLYSSLCEYYVTTFAGSGTKKYEDGQDVHASFRYPVGVTADAFGNIFVVEFGSSYIRKINSSGYVSTYAGNGQRGYSDGQSVRASFGSPQDLKIGLFGNIFVSDTDNYMIRMINASGYVSTLAGNGSASFADGQGKAASFIAPTGLGVDLLGNIFVSDQTIIRRINSTGYVSTIAGSGNFSFSDGQGTQASFDRPCGIVIDALGNLFLSDYGNQRIRKINSTGYVSTFAGDGSPGFSDGQGVEASFYEPDGITIDSIGNLFIADSVNQRIRTINSSGYVTTFAGTGAGGCIDGLVSEATFNYPHGVTIDGNGTIFVADYMNNKIRKIFFATSNPFSAMYSATESLIVTPTSTIFTPMDALISTTILSATPATVATVI